VGHAAADPLVDGLAHEGVIPNAKAALMASVKWRREKPVRLRAVMADAFKTKLP
jgi:anti-sigma regulatory factor (Ser/Thr protein kinase)